jgi:hypothetical protein
MSAAEYMMCRIAYLQRITGVTPNIIDVPSDFYAELCEELGSRGHITNFGCVINGVRIVEGYNRPNDT